MAILLALGSVSSAQDAGKAGADAKDPPIDWSSDTKLDWKNFKGGKPKKDDLDAETAVTLAVPYKCSAKGDYSYDVKAQFDPNSSTTKGANAQTAALLAHEQIHFDLMQKQAIALKTKLEDIFKKMCKCPMSAADQAALKKAVDEAQAAALEAYDADSQKYDDETDHGTKDGPQQKWAEDTAKALGQPAPAPPATSDQPQTPQSAKPDTKCDDCEKLEAERKKKLAELEKKVAPLRQQSKALFGQIDALETQISAANADIEAAQKDLADPKKKAAAQSRITSDNQKVKSAQAKEAPLKTKKEGIDKQIEELERQIAPLQEPIKCPKCQSNPGNSSMPLTDGFASAAPGGPVTGSGDNKCLPPNRTATYFPGTPGQQYATLIPGYDKPGDNVSYSVPSFATDSEVYCTFGEGRGVPGYITASNDNGDFIPPSVIDGQTPGTPPSGGPAMTPKPSETPTPQATEPKTASTPQPSPTPQETPRTDQPSPSPSPTKTPVASNSDTPVPQTSDTPQQPTDTPTPQVPTDTPPVQVTIFIKASETVLTGGETGEPIQGQVVKLVMRDKPELPTTTGDRSLTDKGFDKPAPQCTTSADGGCKIDVPAEDRPLYALDKTPRAAGKPATKFRLAVNIMKHTGGVAETTGKPVPDLKDALTAANATAEVVAIGTRSFLRLGFNTPYGSTEELAKKFSELLGVPVEIDICLVKEPGPPLGSEPTSYAAINQELPNATIKLNLPAKRGAR